MSKIISIHSFRRGTGKSNLTANIAALLAAEGRRIGVVDTDLQSPGIRILFGLDEDQVVYSLNDYLWGKCKIEQAAHDVTPPETKSPGRIFLVPSSTKGNEITRLLREGYDVTTLNDGLRKLIGALKLDVLMTDTHAGLNEETLVSIAASDTLAIVMRLDHQDYQGTGIIIDVAHRLGVSQIMLIINEAPLSFDPIEVKIQVEQSYDCEVISVLPHLEQMMLLASADIFVLRYPHHPVTALLKQISTKLAK